MTKSNNSWIPFGIQFEKRKIVTPEVFLRISRKNKLLIKSSKIIPPKIGSNSLGEILVEF